MSDWSIDTGKGLLIPSFIMIEGSLSIEEKFTCSLILHHLIVETEGTESTALFGELEIAFGIPEESIIKCVQLLQDMNLLTCFRDRYNIGGDKTLYVGHWTREAYYKET